MMCGMYLLAYGINHKSAPLYVRERLAFHPEQTPKMLQALISREAVNEAVLLSTCNRTEIYTASNDGSAIKEWLAKEPRLSGQYISSFCYQYQDAEMVRHLMRVASGLDSMVLGEPQIFGQIKQAYSIACDAGTVGNRLGHLFPAVFAASKQVRTQTAIGNNPVSMAYAVVQLARRIFSDLTQCKILLVGAGETIELVSTHLYGQGARQLIIANRTVERAQKLATQFQARAIRIGDVPACLTDIDIVVTATASQLPILGKGTLESALRQRKRRPIFMADLAMPRDIEPEVSELEDIYLYNLDNLQSVISQNLKNREEAARQAETMVEMQTTHYMRQLRVINAGDMIRNFREQVENVRDQELAKALEHFERSQNPQTALASLAHSLTNKIMHQPTVKLREAAYHEQLDLLLLMKDLFDL